ncbi:uncharacterized protein LOC116203699 [Punica granatum]|uniref:Uncharacterized protein n=2 Tax=Punica granatum TaxID=22663 RepID=A0A218XIN2_PUNGR|nr:uncharacterized protein LOC116203699 [Punica granatum]OWM84797.1 hypothetical protein CDL15_Pgr027584 [Punica granatum]PKI74988.1 hypothetical protein CRG98_004760 [Punica granatum]
MEGLIPIVYRAIKRTQTRRQYECLSSSAAQTYNIADFYPASSYGMPDTNAYTNGDLKAVGVGAGGRLSNGHRRYNSLGDFSFSQDDREFDTGVRMKKQQQQQQLVRFRSHRMFSCITGQT